MYSLKLTDNRSLLQKSTIISILQCFTKPTVAGWSRLRCQEDINVCE